MKTQVSKESLNQIAGHYHLNGQITDKDFDRRFHHLCFEWVNSQLRAGSRVLEMGYGEGNITRQLLEAGMQVDIVEGSQLLAQSASDTYKGAVNVHHALFAEFSTSGHYDAILATNILEHVDDPVDTLGYIHQWCDDDTRVIITVPNAESVHRRLAVLMGIQPQLDTLSPRDQLVGHLRVYTFSQLTQAVQDAGFEIVGQRGFLLKVLPNAMLKDLPNDLIQALYEISDQLDISLLADIGVILRKKQQ
jgi:2-polyprenyl-3-methyl-5-hydroxy-6-metoxy-1,4-benzoquinol methylase